MNNRLYNKFYNKKGMWDASVNHIIGARLEKEGEKNVSNANVKSDVHRYYKTPQSI